MEEFTDSESLHFSEWTDSLEYESMETEGDFVRDETERDGEQIRNNAKHGVEIDRNVQQITTNIRDIQAPLPALHCDGKVFRLGEDQLHVGGFLCSGVLERLLQAHDLYPGYFDASVVQLFGSKYVTGCALTSQLEELFYLLRQHIFKLEGVQSKGRTWPLSDEGNAACLETRKTCSQFMAYVHHFISSCLVKPSEVSHIHDNPLIMELTATPLRLWRELEDLSMFLGRVSDLPSACYMRLDTVGVISSRVPPGSHLFHLYLDMKWNVVQGMMGQFNSQEADADNHSSHHEELTNSIRTLTMELLWELTSIAAVIHDKATRADALKTCPFPCACVCEMWVLLMIVMDHLSSRTDLQSFWSAVSGVLTEILSSRDPLPTQPDSQDRQTPSAPPNFTCRDPVAFSWWLVVQIAPIYWFNRRGVYTVKKKGCIAGNWVFVIDLLKSSLNSLKEGHEETQRRFFIKCALSLSQHWSANPGLIVWLWDYFHRRLNDTFHIPGHSLHGLAIVSSSAVKWMEQSYNRSTNQRGAEAETSYTLFLDMVAVHLSKLVHSGSLQGWKQMKGRFYSKFHKRRMEELNETGLHNFISLFLTLSSVADLEDVATKMCSFLDLLDFNTLLPAKRVFIWRGLFALMLIYKQRNVDFGYLADKMAESFNAVSLEFSEVHSRDKASQRHLWELIMIYLDGTQEIMEHKNKNDLSESKLLGEGFKSLFKACRENELRHVLSFIQSILVIVRSDQERAVAGSPAKHGISDVLWVRVFPYLEQMSSDRQMVRSAATHLADTMAGFALLTFKRHPNPTHGKQEVTFLNLLRGLGLEEDLEPSFCCRFLCHILPLSGVTAVLQSEGLQARVIHTWFRCLLQLPPAHESCQDLTRCVARLPEMEQLITNQQAELASAKNSEKSLKIFIICLGNYHGNLARYEAIQFRERAQNYLGDITKYIDCFLHPNAGPQESLRLSYFVAGSLVKHCSKIIYSKTQPHCLLPRLLDQLVVPLTGSKKIMPPVVQQYAKSFLHLFLQGLRSLDFRRDDFIKRKIKQIFGKYFHPVTQNWHSTRQSGSVTKNPFLVILKDSLEPNPSQDASEFRQFVVDFIKDRFLNLPQPPQNLTPTLSFLDHLLRNTQSTREIARNSPSLLAPTLSCLMACNACSPANEPPSIRRQASEMLRMMLESCKATVEERDTNNRDQILASIKSFVFNNIQQSQGLVFRTCESVAALAPDLIASLIPDMKQAINQSEKTRGVGNDSQLRLSFKSLLQRIGKESEAKWENA